MDARNIEHEYEYGEPRTISAVSMRRIAAQRAWEHGERHLAYTILAVLGILMLALVLLPLSQPEPLPTQDPADALAERYLAALPAGIAPAPKRAGVRATYGTDGGAACAGSNADLWALLVTAPGGTGGPTRFDPVAWRRIQVAHSIYCPARAASATRMVAARTVAARRARAAAIAAAPA